MWIEWLDYDLDENINPEMDDFLSDWFLNSDEFKAVTEIFENNKDNIINISKENLDKLKKSVKIEFIKWLENNFNNYDFNQNEHIKWYIEKLDWFTNLDLLVQNWITTKEEIKYLYENADNITKTNLLKIKSKESFDIFKENNQELLSWSPITKDDIEEQIYLNEEKEEKKDSIEKIINDLFIELLWRDDSIKLKESLWKEFLESLKNSLDWVWKWKQKFIVTLISQYWINENKWEADKYFKDLWYSFKWDKSSWCAAIINWSLKKAWVETIQEALIREKANFKWYESSNVNIRALAFANWRWKAHVAIKIWEDSNWNSLYMWWNQSKHSDERMEGKKWYNRGEVTIRKDKNAKNVLWYREISDDWKLLEFIKEKNSKNIPIWSIVVFARWKWKNH